MADEYIHYSHPCKRQGDRVQRDMVTHKAGLAPKNSQDHQDGLELSLRESIEQYMKSYFREGQSIVVPIEPPSPEKLRIDAIMSDYQAAGWTVRFEDDRLKFS